MAKKKKQNPIHNHVKRIVVITPKFVHGMFIGAVTGALLVLVLRTVNPAAAATAVARDCSTNSIMKCGAVSRSEFISHVKANNPNDLQTVYRFFGLKSSDYSNFIKNAKSGDDMRNGNITVNGKVIATNAWSIGRIKYNGKTAYKIGNRTYYKGSSQQAFGAGINSIPVWVLYDSKGDIQFVVMKACGNPVGGKPVPTPKPKPKPQPKPSPSPTPTPTPTPSPTPTPTPTPITPTKTVSSLPNTGAGAVLIIGLLAIVGGYVFHMTHRHVTRKRHSTAKHHKPTHAHATHRK